MNLPHERQRLCRLVRDTGATGVLFVSGLTHTAGVKFEDWPNRHRIGTLDWTTSFGVTEFVWNQLPPLVRLQIRDGEGDICLQKKVSLGELQPASVRTSKAERGHVPK